MELIEECSKSLKFLICEKNEQAEIYCNWLKRTFKSRIEEIDPARHVNAGVNMIENAEK